MTEPMPLTPAEEAKFRESVHLLEVAEGQSGVNALHWTNTVVARLLDTIDAERGYYRSMVETLHVGIDRSEAAAKAAREFVEWWDSPPYVIADDDVLEARVNTLRAALDASPAPREERTP